MNLKKIKDSKKRVSDRAREVAANLLKKIKDAATDNNWPEWEALAESVSENAVDVIEVEDALVQWPFDSLPKDLKRDGDTLTAVGEDGKTYSTVLGMEPVTVWKQSVSDSRACLETYAKDKGVSAEDLLHQINTKVSDEVMASIISALDSNKE